MSNTTSSSLDRDVSGYVTVGLYTLFILIGIPVNVSTLLYMLKRYRHAKSFLLFLHINLNLTDILVLSLYCSGYIGWQITVEWQGGDLLCRAMRFLDVFVFSASSNIMMSIALYRLYALRFPLWISAVGHSRVPRMLTLAWAAAALVAAPQIGVWRETTFPFGELDSVNVTQCMSSWTEIKWKENRTLLPHEDNQMKGYLFGQIMLMFYIPLVVLSVCYVLILKDIYATLNVDCHSPSVLYLSEMTRMSSCSKRRSASKSADCGVSIHNHYSLRGQDRFQRAKVRSLRITLLLILTYAMTWLPYNLLSWVMLFDFELYATNESAVYFLHCLVVLNSVINPFIYGRCQFVEGIKLIVNYHRKERKRLRSRP